MSTQSASPSLLSSAQEAKLAQQSRLVGRLNRNNAIASSLLWLITIIVAVIFVAIILNLVWTGASTLIKPSFYGTGIDGIGKQLFNTFYILILTEVFLFPISLGAAIFLVEYVNRGPIVTIIHFAAETLAGVPSLVLGMFGYLIFSTDAHMSISRLAGALTLLCLNLPLGLRLFEDALNTVPRELREGGLALGATKWHTIRTVVLPSALPGIITGLILTSGKIIGESAALLFTMGFFSPSNVFTLNPLISSDTLTTHLYYIKGQGAGSTGLTSTQETAVAAGIAATLILLLLIINVSARAVGRQIQRKLTAA
ncbi:MAG TPA: phosphate ABC transporter permease PstA [Ktedonobacteraceae bacterium]|nr:phosphate ABC transporter permease PstA [Ktedonobacteraceae bacterium]